MCVITTLFIFRELEVLRVKDHGKSVVSDFQDKPTVNQAVCGLETSVTQTS